MRHERVSSGSDLPSRPMKHLVAVSTAFPLEKLQWRCEDMKSPSSIVISRPDRARASTSRASTRLDLFHFTTVPIEGRARAPP